MGVFRGLGLVILAMMVGACNLRLPAITPTVMFNLTPSPAATEAPTVTAVMQRLATRTATATLTRTATATPRPPTRRATATETAPPTLTRILPRTATATHTPTATATLTPLPVVQATASPAPTATPLPPTATVLPTLTPLPAPQALPALPTLTPLPTFNPTELAELLGIVQPTATATDSPPTLIPTALPAATDSSLRLTLIPTAPLPPRTAVPLPTASGGDGGLVRQPALPTPISLLGGPTLTPLPTATRFQPTVAVNPNLLSVPIPPPVYQPLSFSAVGAAAYEYEVGLGQRFAYEDVQIDGGVLLFAPHPSDANSFLSTDQNALLWYRLPGDASRRMLTDSPFFQGFAVPSRDENKNRIVEIDWSADGQRFSFRIDTPSGLDNGAAGVWFWQPGNDLATDPTYQIIRDCAAEGDNPCRFVNPSSARFWRTVDVQWSPQPGSSAVLLTLQLPEEGRNALAVGAAVRDAGYANQAPPFVRYDYGYWSADGREIIVSGRREDGRVIIGAVDGGLAGERVLFDASARGLWVEHAVRRPNGEIAALGRAGGPFDGGPLALYDGRGSALSAAIGSAAPDAVRWYADRSAAVVVVQDRQYTVTVDGGQISDTTDLTRNPSFSQSTVQSADALIPAGVIQGSAYYPGQQLRIAIPNLNIRQAPSINAPLMGGLVAGDYVAVIAGPYDSDGYPWWKVQTAANLVGWIAGRIGGAATMHSF